ncbi:MAG: pilin [Candidatus Nomurabacteria bacterium]|nr:pilin [Candidatus Nomurabacteria bacterium]
MKKKLIVLSSSVLSFMPLIALAQPTGGRCSSVEQFGTIQSIICKIGDILDIIIPILIILAVVYFIWGVITYFISDDEEAKKKGRDRIIYGIIGLVVIVAVWGLVGIVNRTFGLGVGTNAPITPITPNY